MKKHLKQFLFFICGVCAFTTAAACAKDENYTGFLEGHLQKVEIGESILLKEYVDFIPGAKYELVAKRGDTTIRLGSRVTWDTMNLDDDGEWELIYTVLEGAYKGTYKTTIDFYAPTISYTYTLSNDLVTYELGETIVYAELFSDINFSPMSYFPCETTMRSVLVDGERINLEGTSEFTFEKKATHYFTFTLDSEDGQTKKGVININVIQTAPEAKQWMRANDVYATGYSEFDANLSVNLNAGWTRYSDKQSDLSYISYNGSYGVGDYVQFDFTGNNMPQLVFFANRDTNSLVDGGRGLYVSNGTLRTNGNHRSTTISSSLYIYGPNKVAGAGYTASSSSFLAEIGDPCAPAAASKLALLDGVKYRYIAGFDMGKTVSESVMTEEQVRADAEYLKRIAKLSSSLTEAERAKQEKAIFDEIKAIREAGSALFHVLLINMDTQEVIMDEAIPIAFTYKQTQTGGRFADGYFSGNIIAYGNFGVTTKLDALYPVYQDQSSIYDVDGCAQFLETVPKYVAEGATLKVSDFVEEVKTDDVFGYVRAEEAKFGETVQFIDGKCQINTASAAFTAVGGETFTLDEKGEYIVYYQDASNRPIGRRIYVGNSAGTIDFDNEETGARPNLITLTASSKEAYKASIVESETGGKHVEIFLPEKTNVMFRLCVDVEYIQYLWSLPDTSYIGFDVKASKEYPLTLNGTVYLTEQWQTVLLNKADCDAWGSSRNYQMYAKGYDEVADGPVILYLDNFRAIKSKTAYLSAVQPNDYTFTFEETATAIKINGEDVAFTQSGNQISIAKALLQDKEGVNTMQVYVGAQAVEYYFEVITDDYGFESGEKSSAFGRDFLTPGLDGSNFYAKLSVVEVKDGAKGNGKYTLQGVAERRMVYIDVSYDYMQFIFGNTTAKYLVYNLYVPQGSVNYIEGYYKRADFSVENWSVKNHAPTFEWIETENCYRVYIPRATYDAWNANEYVTEHRCPMAIRMYMRDTDEIKKTFGTFYMDDFRVIHGNTVYVSKNATGTYTFPFEVTAQKLYINGEEIVFTQTSDGIQISNGALCNLVGENDMQIVTANGSCYYAITIITETMDFEQGVLQAVGVGGLVEAADNASYYASVSVVPTSSTAKGNGAYTLQAVASRRLVNIDLSYEYMQLAFADADTKYLEFKVYVAEGTLSYVRKQYQIQAAGETNCWTHNKKYIKIEWSASDGCYLVKIGRGAFDQYMSKTYVTEHKACFTLGLQADASITNFGTFYIDDFQVKTDVTIGENEQA